MKKIDAHYNQGILENTFCDEKGIYQTFHQDITKLIEDNKRKQNNTNDWIKFDPKKDYHQVLDLSMTDVMKLKNEHGVDIMSSHVDWKYVFKLIETHYPYMKTTTARL